MEIDIIDIAEVDVVDMSPRCQSSSVRCAEEMATTSPLDEVIDLSGVDVVDLTPRCQAYSVRRIKELTTPSRFDENEALMDDTLLTVYFGKHFANLLNRERETKTFCTRCLDD